MNEPLTPREATIAGDASINRDAGESTISPLPGEAGIPNVAARPASPMSMRGLFAVALLTLSLVAVSALSIQRFTSNSKKPGDGEPKLASDRPTAATADPRKLDLPVVPAQRASTTAPPQIPALVPTAEELAEPIGVRRSGQTSPGTGTAKSISPEDAPVLLVSSRIGNNGLAGGAGRSPSARSPEQDSQADPNDATDATTRDLQAYQRQLQGLLDTLTKHTTMVTGQTSEPAAGATALGAASLGSLSGALPGSTGTAAASGALFGMQPQGTATPRAAASMLGNRSLTLPKGTAFTCTLKTKVISAASGLVGCQVQRNVFGDDGRVLLIERGSHMDGEYRISSVRPGTIRIPVLWTRIRTPNGVTVDIESPGTGQLGESGIDGYVDNRWGERIGAAMLLSLIDDSVKLVIQNQTNDSQANTVVLPATTANTSKLAEKVLDSTINIPPLIYQNQGGIVGIYVARDVDFSSVYELKPVSR